MFRASSNIMKTSVSIAATVGLTVEDDISLNVLE